VSASTTIYAECRLDSVFATAVLAIALGRKGYRVFVEFPEPTARRGLNILNSYSVDITHLSGASLRNSIALTHIPEKRLGIVYRYGSDGKYSAIMQFNNMNSTLELSLEYIKTLNENVIVPQEIVSDLARIKLGELGKLTRLGRTLYYAYRWNIRNHSYVQTLYNFAYTSLMHKRIKVTDDIQRDARNFEEALKIKDKLINEGIYTQVGDAALVVISDEEPCNEFIRNNFEHLRVVAYDVLNELCRKHPLSILIYKDVQGHEVRVCGSKAVATNIVNYVNELPEDVKNLITYSTRRTCINITFRDLSKATLDNALKVANEVIANYLRPKT